MHHIKSISNVLEKMWQMVLDYNSIKQAADSLECIHLLKENKSLSYDYISYNNSSFNIFSGHKKVE